MSQADSLDLPAFLDRRAAVACLRCSTQFAPCGFALARHCGNAGCPLAALAAAAPATPIDLPNFLGRPQ